MCYRVLGKLCGFVRIKQSSLKWSIMLCILNKRDKDEQELQMIQRARRPCLGARRYRHSKRFADRDSRGWRLANISPRDPHTLHNLVRWPWSLRMVVMKSIPSQMIEQGQIDQRLCSRVGRWGSPMSPWHTQWCSMGSLDHSNHIESMNRRSKPNHLK